MWYVAVEALPAVPHINSAKIVRPELSSGSFPVAQTNDVRRPQIILINMHRRGIVFIDLNCVEAKLWIGDTCSTERHKQARQAWTDAGGFG
jgi:hypothetical protein